MPLIIDDNAPTKFPTPQSLTLGNFKRGVITLLDQSKLPKNALKEADNMYLTEDGTPSTRPGVGFYGNSIGVLSRTATFTTETNLATNPSLEVDASTWTALNGGTPSRVLTQQYIGTASLQVVTSGGADSGVQSPTYTGLTSNTTYTYSAYIKGTAGQYIAVQIDSYTTASAYVATAFNQVLADGSWQRVSVPSPLGPTATRLQAKIYVNNSATTFYLDAAQLEQASAATAHFDGTFTNTASIDYAWTGTAHASTSTRTTYVMAIGEVDGIDYFDAAGVIHLVAVVNGTVYRSLDNALTWTACTSGSFTAATPVEMNQNGAFLYMTTGVNNILRYDGTTVLQAYTALTTPAAPTVARTGLIGTNFTVYYKIAAVNVIGFSIASAKVSQAVLLPRDSWNTTTDFLTLTLPTPQATQTRADIFYSDDDLTYYYLDSIVSSTAVPNVTYKDNNTAVVIPSTLAPTGNTTQGPRVAELTNVGSRQYGVRDPNNRYRIWFTGTGSFSGAFSNSYDGGYLDWQPGGKYVPMHVEDYRDGKGTPLATIWCDSADGQGCILQMSLETVSTAGASITLPSAYKLPGSRGTSAPGSVVNVLNDYMYYNSQAFYNLGSRAQFLNLLSTDESSANIRPTVRQISAIQAPKIASVYSDAKVLFSVAYGTATQNSHTIVYDTEQKAWLPTAFTIGFKKFLKYTDTAGVRRLLAVRPGDNRLSEISNDIQGDYGLAFRTSLLTGLYQTTKNRFEFQTTENGFVEFTNPQGTVNIDVLGVERSKGYTTVKTVPFVVLATVTNAGWDTFDDDVSPWDNTAVAAKTYSESSVKRYFPIQREMNAIQWHITTYSLDSRYTMRTLQTDGTDTQAGPPRQWRIGS